MSQKSKLNFVAEAQIWKDHLETEREAARKWPKRWGFLLTSVEELVKDEKKQPAKPKILLPEHLQIRPVTPVEKYIKKLLERCLKLAGLEVPSTIRKTSLEQELKKRRHKALCKDS